MADSESPKLEQAVCSGHVHPSSNTATPELTTSGMNTEPPAESSDIPGTSESLGQALTSKEEEDEEEEEEEENKILEKSPSGRFHKRNMRYPRQVPGIDNTYIAIEPKSGKEVLWNEIDLPEKRMDLENRFLAVVKKLKKNYHPFLVRFLDAWNTKNESGPRKMIFVTERIDEATLKQFMYNSERSHRLWKKHVGQILSVLKFLREVGVMHGNLTNETIYYQSSGSLKVGTFALDGLLNPAGSRDGSQSRQPIKFLAPEYDTPDAKLTPAVDIYALGLLALQIAAWDPADDAQGLSQSDLVASLLERVKDQEGRYFCRPAERAFIEACLVPNPEDRPTLKALINHPAMIEVPTLKQLAAKVMVDGMSTWEDSNQTDTNQQSFAALLRDMSSHLEDDTVLVEVHYGSEVRSRTWKDFRSNFTLTSKYLEDVKNGFYPFFGCKAPCMDTEENEDNITSLDAPFDPWCPSKSQEPPPSNEAPPSRQLSDDTSLNTTTMQGVTENVDVDSGAMTATKPASASPKSTSPPLTPSKRGGNDSSELSGRPLSPEKVVAGTKAGQDDSADAPNVNVATSIQPIQQSTSVESPKINGSDLPNTPLQETVEQPDLNHSIQEEYDDDEDEEEEETHSRQHEPKIVQVAPPDRAPQPAVFTHCEYTYLGCGRWQVYLQIWFVEERLKREGFLQVLDHEWHNVEHVASLFESSHSIAAEDKPRLMRLLDCAKHLWPLVDGELKGPLVQLSHFDANELHERLTLIQQHQQAKDVMDAAMDVVNAAQHQVASGTAPVEVEEHVQMGSGAKTQGSESIPASPMVTDPPTGEQEQGIQTEESVPCTQLHNETTKRPETISPPPPTGEPSQPTEAVRSTVQDPNELMKGMKVGQLPNVNLGAMMDMGVLAPRNHHCPHCDRHDYLHRCDLPAYLTSPCYHCREALALEAKVEPERLHDLHVQNQIPWPGFLQTRLGIPKDGRTPEEVIVYDCRWRSRKPCRCLPQVGPQPPCVEFPWLYPEEEGDATPTVETAEEEEGRPQSNTPSGTASPKQCTPATDNAEAATPLNGTGPADSTPVPAKNLTLPCAHRHARGAPTTCSHGYHFPHLAALHGSHRQKKAHRT